jgi:hypothetical protein
MESPVVLQLGDCTVSCSYLLPHQRGDARLQELLRDSYGDPGITVINEGLDGESTEDFLRRYDRTLARYPHVDLAMIRYGVNDRKRAGADLFIEQLALLCDRLELDRPNLKIVLETGIYVDYPQHYAFDRNSKLTPLYDQIRQLAQSRRYPLVDVYARMRRETESGNWDLRARGFGAVDEEHPVLGPALDHVNGHDVRWFTNIHPNLQGVAVIVDEERKVLTTHYPKSLRDGRRERLEAA